MAPPSKSAPRLHVVTGKGGTGKTTLSAALAQTLAAQGKRVLLLEVEERQGLAPLLGVQALNYREEAITDHLFAMSVEPKEAFLEYLELFYKAGVAGRTLDKFGVIEFATTIAPGLRDVLLTGKAYEATRRRPGKLSSSTFEGPWVYDAVVMDAPPTGRIGKFLDINSQLSSLAKVGPIRKQAESIDQLMRSKMTTVHFTTLLEEMPIQETLDGIVEMRRLGIQVGYIFANQVEQKINFVDFYDPIDSDIAASLRLEIQRYQQVVARQDILFKEFQNESVIEIPYLRGEINFESLTTLHPIIAEGLAKQ